MKKVFFGLFTVTTIIFFGFTNKEKIKSLKLGKTAPLKETKMKDVSGENLSLSDIKKENGLLVIFTCNTCPFVVGSDNNEGWEGRYNTIYDIASKNKIGMALINSNEGKRDGADSYEAMKKRSNEQQYKAPYLLDKNNVLADEFGASTTPHIFLFDKDMKLVYKGAIDDNVKDAEAVKEEWLKKALVNIYKGIKVDPAETRNSGCSIKRLK